jgi:hypothetical protein
MHKFQYESSCFFSKYLRAKSLLQATVLITTGVTGHSSARKNLPLEAISQIFGIWHFGPVLKSSKASGSDRQGPAPSEKLQADPVPPASRAGYNALPCILCKNTQDVRCT